MSDLTDRELLPGPRGPAGPRGAGEPPRPAWPLRPAESPHPAQTPRAAVRHKLSMFDRLLLIPAVIDAFRKLHPRVQWRNPVMFVVYVGSILTTLLWVQALGGRGEAPAWFILNVAIWLWFTVLFANLAEALDRKSTRLNSSHPSISYAVFCLKKKQMLRYFICVRFTRA